MTKSIADCPIGIFDSGVGGLTVAKAICDLLPNEQIIYFGDTAHAPWGDKSNHAIIEYSTKIVDILLAQHCKVIIVACNSASAVALTALMQYIDNKAILLNVIDPTITYLANNHANSTIGLIGTKQTINSNIYQQKLNPYNIQLKSLATPLLVPIIEEGLLQHEITRLAIAEYLDKSVLHNISALVLGCTHYPLIKSVIQQYYAQEKNIDIIDSAIATAKTLQNMLLQNNLFNTATVKANKFYISDYTKHFEVTAKLFFGNKVVPEERKLT
ncbi:MAG: glutamate racemase [Legionellales bacterium]|nr:MAG: glutamate racemase [Legionellales bacterium]